METSDLFFELTQQDPVRKACTQDVFTTSEPKPQQSVGESRCWPRGYYRHILAMSIVIYIMIRDYYFGWAANKKMTGLYELNMGKWWWNWVDWHCLGMKSIKSWSRSELSMPYTSSWICFGLKTYWSQGRGGGGMWQKGKRKMMVCTQAWFLFRKKRFDLTGLESLPKLTNKWVWMWHVLGEVMMSRNKIWRRMWIDQ